MTRESEIRRVVRRVLAEAAPEPPPAAAQVRAGNSLKEKIKLALKKIQPYLGRETMIPSSMDILPNVSDDRSIDLFLEKLSGRGKLSPNDYTLFVKLLTDQNSRDITFIERISESPWITSIPGFPQIETFQMIEKLLVWALTGTDLREPLSQAAFDKLKSNFEKKLDALLSEGSPAP